MRAGRSPLQRAELDGGSVKLTFISRHECGARSTIWNTAAAKKNRFNADYEMDISEFLVIANGREQTVGSYAQFCDETVVLKKTKERFLAFAWSRFRLEPVTGRRHFQSVEQDLDAIIDVTAASNQTSGFITTEEKNIEHTSRVDPEGVANQR